MTEGCSPRFSLLCSHLRILDYPSAKEDHSLNFFDSQVRTIRERVKTMENISYFLVSKIEKKDAKTILHSYPCSQPSDSLAFRISLAIYIENIRHHAVFRANNQKVSWWKDVVVRKSLLEQCSGMQFERLMLSLSTHVLMTMTMSSISTSSTDQETYVAALVRCQSDQHHWESKAVLLLQSELNLDRLKARFDRALPSRYNDMSTSDLHSLVKTRIKDLSRRYWQGSSGENALLFLLRCLEPPFSDLGPDHWSSYNATQSLEEAALHHPSLMKRLRRPAFKISPMSPRLHSHTVVGHLLDVLQNQKKTLLAALQDMKELTTLLKLNIDAYRQIGDSDVTQSSLWRMPYSGLLCINLDVQRNQALLSSADLLHDWTNFNSDSLEKDPVENRIQEIRGSLSPLIPYLPSCSLLSLARTDAVVPRTSACEVARTSPKDKAPHPVDATMVTLFGETEPLLGSAKLHLAVPSIGTGSRSARRQSTAMSIRSWFKKRTSIFDLSGNELENEVDKLIGETHDSKTDSEDDDIVLHQGPITPRTHKPFIKRIITAGTPTSLRRNVPQPRLPSGLARLLDVDPSASLPNLASFTSSLGSSSSRPAGTSNLDISALSHSFLACNLSSTLSPAGSFTGNLAQCDNTDHGSNGEETWFDDEPPSMTIDDILSTSGISHFDLIEQSSEDIDNVALIEDIWE